VLEDHQIGIKGEWLVPPNKILNDLKKIFFLQNKELEIFFFLFLKLFQSKKQHQKRLMKGTSISNSKDIKKEFFCPICLLFEETHFQWLRLFDHKKVFIHKNKSNDAHAYDIKETQASFEVSPSCSSGTIS